MPWFGRRPLNHGQKRTSTTVHSMFANPLRLSLALVLVVAAYALTAIGQNPSNPAGTILVNRAEASYNDGNGNGYSTVSETITLTIRSVAGLAVTPDETNASEALAPNGQAIRLFRICNTGNTPDSYKISSTSVTAPSRIEALYFDLDGTGTISAADVTIVLNVTDSPVLSIGSCVAVLADIRTEQQPPNTRVQIKLRARSNDNNSANGIVEDEGTIVNAVGLGAYLTSPADANLPPQKTINGDDQAVVGVGQPFSYTIAFRNSGDVLARDVLITDDLVDGIEYLTGSLRLNNALLSEAEDGDAGTVRGKKLEIRIPSIALDEVVRITFQARVTSATPGAGLPNVAQLTGANFLNRETTPARVVIDPYGTIFEGRSSGTPIPQARVALSLDAEGQIPLSIPQIPGFAPNTTNTNPYSSDSDGHYSFALALEQLGTSAQPARYYLNVTSSGHRARLLELNLLQTQPGLFNTTVRALDGQSLARPGSFELTNEPLSIENLAALTLNIPMFETAGLEISKNVDKQNAEIGEIVTYRIVVHNPTNLPISGVHIDDELPASFHYASGTAHLGDGNSPTARPIEPSLAGNRLSFELGNLAPGASVQISYRVRIGVNARPGRQENRASALGVYPTGDSVGTQAASAFVYVGSGVFSSRQLIIGRVYLDRNGNGQFESGDEPMAGVRLYLNNGQTVTTDTAGLYNIPSIGDGSYVISLDPMTVPAGYSLADTGVRSERSWTRMLRTPLGGGSMLRQNFALVRKGREEVAKESAPAPLVLSQTAPVDSASQKFLKVAETRLAPGTYEMESTEKVEPVPPGEIKVLSPAADEVILDPALHVEVRVAAGWKTSLELNGSAVPDNRIGKTVVDRKHSVVTYTYVGLNLAPGLNKVVATAVGDDGRRGQQVALLVMGRGPVRSIHITADRNEISASGRDETLVRVFAKDEWGNPAIDSQVAIETTGGQLFSANEDLKEVQSLSAVAHAIAMNTDRASGVGVLATINPDSRAENSEREAVRSQLIVSFRRGLALVRFVGNPVPGQALLHAVVGQLEANTQIRLTPELRPSILVGMADFSFGRALPETNMRQEEGNVRSRLSFFYKGRLFSKNMLTLAYDSQRPLNRTAGSDRIFQLDPQERLYPVLGDSSVRFEEAQSNSKLYFRLDRGRSYAMFGDMEADMDGLQLAGYSRKLTGIKVHAENASGDFITLTGARPDTAFARDIIPGGSFSLSRLSHGEILPGSESVVLEVRDRRNPEIIISREPLARSVDYNMNSVTGEIFFLRPISTFDYQLNLLQVVVTYEHRANGLSSAVYTGRASKHITGLGLRLGLSFVNQRQGELGSFALGGIEGEKSLARGGRLKFEWATSRGRVAVGGFNGESANNEHDGHAFHSELEQPLPFYEGVLRAGFARSSAGFLNPFGATVAPGAQRATVSLELKPRPVRTLRFGITDERNRTETVDNHRLTAGVNWTEAWRENVRTFFGFEHRRFSDNNSDNDVTSNLVTVGAEYRPTDKLELSIKREQNMGAADPTYPNQTTLAANYQINNWTKLFFTQRLASAPIVPIADVAGTGFASTGARRETAIGVETKLGRFSALNGRYQLENGINGTDSFAVIGLQNRLPITKALSLELGYERGFHLAGNGQSFNNVVLGFSWLPTDDLRTSARYELRDRNGFGQLLALGVAGRFGDNVTALAQFQWARAVLGERGNSSLNDTVVLAGRGNSSLYGTAALAFRPLHSDRVALLFSYNRRSRVQEGAEGVTATRDRADTLSVSHDLELYGRFALKLSANGDPNLPFVSTLTYLSQIRAQQRLGRYFDVAGEARLLFQPVSRTRRTSYGAELGFWVLRDLRIGGGYNFASAAEPLGGSIAGARRGFYFTISSKLSNLFNLFGTSSAGLSQNEPGPAQRDNAGGKQP